MKEPGGVLDVVTSVVIAAGNLIRKDFHRAGGPRGHGHHAEVDEEAERVIRERLLEAFPDWGYLGEETGSAGPSDAEYRWLVDPNDGTASYLKGMRGSAVSVGLVRDGLPVLGVVYAPTYPDDRGDLIAWADGLPLTRNGKKVRRVALPDTLIKDDVVLLSQGGDDASLANGELVYPARYGTLPSIAYRLALLAAGEGEAAISLNGPVDWDLAGGHALVKAVGGDLYGRDGQAVRYGSDSGPRGPWFAAGTGTVARTLLSRDWGRVFREREKDSGYSLAHLERSHVISNPDLLSSAQGCLLGQLAGDSLGSLVEFRSADSIRAEYPDGVRDLADGGCWNTLAGQPTDDSEMALMLARSILVHGGYDAEATADAYRWWKASGPFDIGGTTSAGLAGHPNLQSQANGSLMRISPLAVWGHALPADHLANLAREDSAITHPHLVCGDSCAVFVVAAAHAIRTGDGASATYEVALDWARKAHAEHAVIESLEAAANGPPDDFQTQQGWVLIALQNAFYQLLHAPNLEEGIIDTVMRGGDTDTTAAIAGVLLGAIHGRDAVPTRWRQALLSCRPIRGLPQVHRPRPKPLWPVDALELAERLVVTVSG